MRHGIALDLTQAALLGGVPAWVLRADGVPADIDMDFFNRRYRGKGEIDITCSRASTKWLLNSAGVYSLIAINALPISDLGILPEAAATNSLRTSNVLDTPGSLAYGAEATDNVELLTNTDFATNLSGWSATAAGGSSITRTGPGAVTFTYDGTNLPTLDQSFATIPGHRYTIVPRISSISTVTPRVFIGTSQGGTTFANSAMNLGMNSKSFVASSTTTWVRIEGATAAGSFVLHGVSAMLGGIPSITSGAVSTWNYVDGSVNGLDMNVRVTQVATDANGLPYLRFRIFGTTGSGGSWSASLRFEQSNSIAAAVNDIWTASVGHRLAAGAVVGFSALTLNAAATNGSSTLSATGGALNITPVAGWTRDQVSAWFNNASTTNTYESLNWTVPANTTVDLSIELQVPQLEKSVSGAGSNTGGFATSPILTTTSAVARAADALTISGVSLSSNITIYAEGGFPTLTGFQGQFAADDGTGNNAVVLRTNNGDIGCRVITAGVNKYAVVGTTVYTARTSIKQALAVSDGAQDYAYNGSLKAAGTGTPTPTGLTRLTIGGWNGSAEGDFLKRVSLWNSKRTGAGIASITT